MIPRSDEKWNERLFFLVLPRAVRFTRLGDQAIESRVAV